MDAAHQQIRSQILNGQLSAGAPLQDSVLAERMGVSRSPVREALRLLEKSGLVQKTANRSYRVSEPAPTEVPELALLRVGDEVTAVRHIVRTRLPLSRVDSALERLQQAARGDDPDALADADAGFHATVVDLAGLPRLSARYADLTDQIRLVLLTGGLQREWKGDFLYDNHVELRDALSRAVETGDASDVAALWESHISAGMQVTDFIER